MGTSRVMIIVVDGEEHHLAPQNTHVDVLDIDAVFAASTTDEQSVGQAREYLEVVESYLAAGAVGPRLTGLQAALSEYIAKESARVNAGGVSVPRVVPTPISPDEP